MTAAATAYEPDPRPDGIEALPGVVDLYDAYDKTMAARVDAQAKGTLTREVIDAAAKAHADLAAARAHWRKIRLAVTQRAYDEWAKANPEAAAKALADAQAEPAPVATNLGVQKEQS